MSIVSITNTLDVIEKYRELVKESLSSDSVYIRAKETLQALVDDNIMDEARKAEIISNVIGNAVNAITGSSMSTALQWASAEKDVALRKLELEKQLDILDNDKYLKEAQADQIRNAIRLSKVESKRVYGTAVFDNDDNIISLDNSGKVYKDMLLVEANTTKVGTEDALTAQKITESQAAVHKIVADTYVNHGNYTYSPITSTGISGVTPQHGAYKTLSDSQRDIAIEQAKGYTYSAWANALTGSASMLGTAIAAEYAEFGPGQPGGILLDTILDTANALKSAQVP